MNKALIGYTGFVGTTLRTQTSFMDDDLYHSKNIQAIGGKSYDLVICAGAPATKWKANQNPDEDWANIQMLIGHLKELKAQQFVLISTIDVYRVPVNVNEQTPIETENLHAYGLNRYRLETFVKEHFPQSKIIRLPGLFGAGLKKNFLFDMIHHGESAWTHHESVFQFYNMANLWTDIELTLNSSVELINFATEPVKVADIAEQCFDKAYRFVTETPPVYYDMQTLNANLFGKQTHYIASADEIFAQIRHFIAQEKQ